MPNPHLVTSKERGRTGFNKWEVVSESRTATRAAIQATATKPSSTRAARTKTITAAQESESGRRVAEV